MLNPVPTLAALPTDPTLWQSIEFILLGFLFVVFVLAAIGVLTSLVGAMFKRLEPPPVEKPVQVAKAKAQPVPAKDPNLPVVIAAAVYAVMGDKPHRILQIRPADESWAREGRRSILGSHKVR